MPQRPLQDVVHYLRRLTAPAGWRDVSDAELLDRFARQRDQAAFELLVWRHGKMVLSVCRRLLRHEQDAEDAFQAVFMALARRAAALGHRESVGGWLYRVAFRIALRARATEAKRTIREHAVPPSEASLLDPGDEAALRELRQAIDEEVNRLPEKYRVPFVLCHFDGRSNAEAARELGCPIGTLESWLVRARQRLRGQLARRGVMLPTGLLAAGFTALAAPTELSASLIRATARAASLTAMGETTTGIISAQASMWMEGALRTMSATKFKIVTLLVLTVGLTGGGVGTWGRGPSSAAENGLEKKDRVGRLIHRLGSDLFSEREEAGRELDRIGPPALAALRDAAKSDDPEVRRRAARLARRIERRRDEEEILRGKRMQLVFVDTPLTEALAEFEKKSGYRFTLHDSKGKLKGRKVTLATGDVTFWEALELFGQAAGLVEGESYVIPQAQFVMDQFQPNLQNLQIAAFQLQPNVQIPANLFKRVAALPAAPVQRAAPIQANRLQPAARIQANKFQPAVQLQAAQFVQFPAAQVVQPQAIVQLQPALPFVQLRSTGGIDCGESSTRPIVLRDGKPSEEPTVRVGAIRMRLLPKKFGDAKRKDILLGLQIAVEPKVRWRSATAVHIDKAVDDRGQELKPLPQGSLSFHAQNVYHAAPVRGSVVPIALRKRDKQSKSLKELRGTITAEVLSEPKTVLTVDNVLKAEGKTFRFSGGWLKIVKVQRQGDRIQVGCELTATPLREDQSRNPFQLSLESENGSAKEKSLGEPNRFAASNGSPMKVVVEGKLPKGRQSARMVLGRSRTITVTIPFVFRDVPLPSEPRP